MGDVVDVNADADVDDVGVMSSFSLFLTKGVFFDRNKN